MIENKNTPKHKTEAQLQTLTFQSKTLEYKRRAVCHICFVSCLTKLHHVVNLEKLLKFTHSKQL